MSKGWTRHASKTILLEKRFGPKLARVITRFRNRFISDLKEHGEAYARNQLSKVTIDGELLPIVELIYKTAGVTGGKLLRDEHRKYIREAQRKAASFGRNERWIQQVMNYLRMHGLFFVQNITDTLREDIIRTLQKAVDEGLGISETVKLLTDSRLITARATVIARTEINRASNTGHSIAARELPYEVDKKWSSARDHRTRHSHVLINGHITDELGTFRVAIYQGKKQIGWDEMQFPGDPDAHPSNTINCRCRVTYVPKRDADGVLVMREVNQAPVIPIRRPSQFTPEQIAAQLKSHITIGVE